MADPIGDINTRWDDQTDTIEVRVKRSWVRSFRQTFSTALGDEFTLRADMERVVVLVDGEDSPEHRAMPTLTVTATDCAADPELGPHALAIQEHLTALLGILLERARAATQPS